MGLRTTWAAPRSGTRSSSPIDAWGTPARRRRDSSPGRGRRARRRSSPRSLTRITPLSLSSVDWVFSYLPLNRREQSTRIYSSSCASELGAPIDIPRAPRSCLSLLTRRTLASGSYVRTTEASHGQFVIATPAVSSSVRSHGSGAIPSPWLCQVRWSIGDKTCVDYSTD